MTTVAVTGRLCVGDPVPAVLTLQELMNATGYSRAQLEEFRRRRNHPGIKQLEAPGHPRFCGRTLKAWIDSGAPAPVRQFFGAARRRTG